MVDKMYVAAGLVLRVFWVTALFLQHVIEVLFLLGVVLPPRAVGPASNVESLLFVV
jgi:hypothetical protein